MVHPNQLEPILNLDVFSNILAYISCRRTIQLILEAFPITNPLFSAVLIRRFELPLYVDTYSKEATKSSRELLECFLHKNSDRFPSVRHLSIAFEAESDNVNLSMADDFTVDAWSIHETLPGLVRASSRLHTLNYFSFPGLALNPAVIRSLTDLNCLQTVTIDCSLSSSMDNGSGGRHYAWQGELASEYDGEIWDLGPFASTVGRRLTTLELRHVNLTFYKTMVAQYDTFSTYHRLKHLKMDITAGVWDWRGGGPPVQGASPDFRFQHLGFPAVTTLELDVGDLTLSRATYGPLKMVSCDKLTELRILVRYSLPFDGQTAVWHVIGLFETLTPQMIPALRLLEIKDNAWNERYYWNDASTSRRGRGSEQVFRKPGREYPGIVSGFLSGAQTGDLANLTHLWVDERVLCQPGRTVPDVFTSTAPNDIAWVSALETAFRRLSSVRVGFGPLQDESIKLVTGLCDPAKLVEFGFEWNWEAFERNASLSPKLLTCLSTFPHLKSVHFLFPRPIVYDKKRPALPYPPENPHTLADVAAIFETNLNVARVGVGNSILWERYLPSPLLVSDGKNGPEFSVPRFFKAGYQFCKEQANADNYEPLRPEYTEEIGQLRDILKRVLV
ncbi:hypothetical protein MIND_01202200 [Mycena indigotica]|uniref:Uncharacterized protein n=1 Tax=Mycena indigotica TaxID=2126181 RepID=A0A8H6VWT1_9AGAR|nr:uncharacterized protein MIND_01202200 [Mycena indigotica]KAF7293028.1 hypothetical protein MIND_01202200 [Mycena indigotica]